MNLPWTEWPPFCRRHLQPHFLEWKYYNFDSNFTEICSYVWVQTIIKSALVRVMAWRIPSDKPPPQPTLTQIRCYVSCCLSLSPGEHSDGMVSPGGAPEQKVSQPVAVTDSAVPTLFHVWFNCLTLSYNDLYLLKFDGLLSFSHIFFSISSLHARILRISPIHILL